VYSVFVIFYSYFYFLHFEWQWKSSWNCLLISQTNLHEYHQYTLSLKVKNAD
jgi:hypothetical protein